MGWMGHVSVMGYKRNAANVLVGKHEGGKTFERLRHN
jgi:hypothetical protein